MPPLQTAICVQWLFYTQNRLAEMQGKGEKLDAVSGTHCLHVEIPGFLDI